METTTNVTPNKFHITPQAFERVMALRNEHSIAAIMRATPERLRQIRQRAQDLLREEKHVTCYQFVPRTKQKEAAQRYRDALKATIALCNSQLRVTDKTSPILDESDVRHLTKPDVQAAAEQGAGGEASPPVPADGATDGSESENMVSEGSPVAA